MVKYLKQYFLIIGFIGLIFSLYLVTLELIISNFCPKIFGIPACYLVLLAFIFVILSEFFKIFLNNLFFYLGWLIGFILALWFSFCQIVRIDNCPLFFEIPMCYLSLIIFVIILFIKINIK
jgi:hypothetical protein